MAKRVFRIAGAGAALLTLLGAGPAMAQALPDPPPGDRQPVGLSAPRIAPLPESQWTDEHRRLVDRYAGDGRADSQLHTLLNVPAIVEGLMPFTVYLTEASTLTPRHRSLLILRAAWLCGNQPIWATNAARARDGGMTDGEIRRIAEGPDAAGWDPLERTLLQLADQLYLNSSVADDTWSVLAARLSEHNLIDAVETANHFMVLSMIYNAFGIQPDDDTPDRLPADVPYRITVPEREPRLAMARLEPLDGPGIAVRRTFARHPAMAEARGPRAGYINRISPLSPHDREILILRIGWNCQAVYEWAKHVGTVGRARDHGVDPRAVALGPDAPGAGGREAILLRLVDELYQNAIVSDETWRALTAEYDTVEAMSAVYTPSSYRATSMSLNAYGVQLEPGDEGFPDVPLR
ncbi:MAG: carboxymuconolactone decarboxylase family protein [Acidobacteria bacterium]|nr:carboxymuconolactone decarboxylase family protein [Acidobacteriota bacterium]